MGAATMSATLDATLRQQLQAPPPHNIRALLQQSSQPSAPLAASPPPNSNASLSASSSAVAVAAFSPAACLDCLLSSRDITSPASISALDDLLTALPSHSASLRHQQHALLSASALTIQSHASLISTQHRTIDSLTVEHDAIHNSLTSDLDTLAPFTASLQSLLASHTALTSSHLYLQLVARAEQLTEQGKREVEAGHVQQAGKTVLTVSRLLAQVKEERQRRHSAATGAAGVDRLYVLLRHRLLWLLRGTKTRLVAMYNELLAALHWPQTQQTLMPTHNEQLMATFSDMTETLLLLQIEAEPTTLLSLDSTSAASPPPSEPSDPAPDPTLPSSPVTAHPIARLWIFDLLFSPIHTRFVYHFTGDKPTNRLDRPEFITTFVINVLQLHLPFLQQYVQPILRRSPLQAIDVSVAFITSLLAVLRQHLLTVLSQLMVNARLFRHYVDELLTFEQQLRSTFLYPEELPSLLPLLTSGDVFERWLSVDKEWVNDRLKAMRDMQEPWARVSDGREAEEAAGGIDLDDSDDEDTDVRLDAGTVMEEEDRVDGEDGVKERVELIDPSLIISRSANMLVTLVSSITTRFTPLPSLSARLRFVQDIQYQLLDIYLEWVEEESVRLLPTVTKGMQAMGGGGSGGGGGRVLRTYCMLLNSLHYVESVLLDWSDTVTFIELRYFQAHSELPADTTVAQLIQRIGEGGAGVDVDGSVFDAMVQSYHDGRERMTKGVVDAIIDCFYAFTKQYRKLGHQSVVRDDSPPSSPPSSSSSPPLVRLPSATMDVSPTLVPALLTLKLQLLILSRNLSSSLFSLVFARTCSRLDTLLFSTLLSSSLLSHTGSRQLSADLSALILTLAHFGHTTRRLLGSVVDAVRVLDWKRREMQQALAAMDEPTAEWVDVSEEDRRRWWRDKWRIHKLTEDEVRAIVAKRRAEEGADKEEEVEVAEEEEEEVVDQAEDDEEVEEEEDEKDELDRKEDADEEARQEERVLAAEEPSPVLAAIPHAPSHADMHALPLLDAKGSSTQQQQRPAHESESVGDGTKQAMDDGADEMEEGDGWDLEL